MGVCHGVIYGIAPSATIIDVTHAIEPFNVLQGAAILADAIPYLPNGVHVAIVDPEVGTERRAVAVKCDDGRTYVGPDNGILTLAAARSGIACVIELDTRPAPAGSRTFAGRDLFVPAAAHLARGVELSSLGQPIGADSLAEISIPAAKAESGYLRAPVLAVDRFGTLQLACSVVELEESGLCGPVLVNSNRGRGLARRAETFSEVEIGELLLYEDSFRRIALAVREGNASDLLDAGAGDWISLSSDPAV